MEENLLIALLRRAVTGELPGTSRGIRWEELLDMARRHHVIPMLYYALRGDAELPPAVASALERGHYQEIFCQMQQDYTAGQVEEALREAGIPYAPMKGMLLKHDYPAEDMRSMTDLDYYVREEDDRLIRERMEALGAVYSDHADGEMMFRFQTEVIVEFHHSLLVEMSDAGPVHCLEWQCVDTTRNRLTEEGFALHLICHALHHLAVAGVGVRFVLDLWVYRNRHPSQPDWRAVEQKLEQLGLGRAAKNLMELSEYWFGNGSATPELLELGEYILESGIYGTMDQGYQNRIGFNGGVRQAFLNRAFPNRREMELSFPWLEKYPWLLPLAWVIRLVRILPGNGIRVFGWMKKLTAPGRGETDSQRRRLERFGFQFPEKD